MIRRDVEVLENLIAKSRLIATGFHKGVSNGPGDFKSLVSACSTTPAAIDYDNTIFLCRQVTAGPDSGHKHPDNCPGTSQAPANS